VTRSPEGGLLADINAPPVDVLQGTSFRNHTFPGIALFVIVRGTALAAACLLLMRHPQAASSALLSGTVIIGFQVVEVLAIGSDPGVARFKSTSHIAHRRPCPQRHAQTAALKLRQPSSRERCQRPLHSVNRRGANARRRTTLWSPSKPPRLRLGPAAGSRLVIGNPRTPPRRTRRSSVDPEEAGTFGRRAGFSGCLLCPPSKA
jgi:hypothetical protein